MFTPFDTMEKGDGHPTDRRTDTARQHRPCLCRHRAAKKQTLQDTAFFPQFQCLTQYFSPKMCICCFSLFLNSYSGDTEHLENTQFLPVLKVAEIKLFSTHYINKVNQCLSAVIALLCFVYRFDLLKIISLISIIYANI